jgi:hypothetical protein
VTGGVQAPAPRPLAVPRYYNRASGRMETAQAMRAYRPGAAPRAPVKAIGTPLRVKSPAPKPAAAPAAPWAPPPWPPTGAFNPQRELEVGEAKRGLEQQELEGNTTRTRYGSAYATDMSEYDRQGREQTDAYNKGLALLAESYQRLGTRQTEAANKAGLLQGGALLQSAATRGANEAKERQKRTEANTLAQEKLDRARGKMIEELGPPDVTNPAGGTKWQDLSTKLANLASNFTFYQQGQQALAGQEAAFNKGWEGYAPPKPPAAKPAPKPPPPKAPGGGVRLWNAGQKRMMTYRGGKWY